ncbi:Beta-transducin like protein [Giardia duodenalis]|uniref:Beta-transducin like protein n=1 Tax=Giardia intestinalis TaxID=5741 RepID=V6U0I8_GIAIN|nr:Beta-transducin like protein [Giardia intestinalis]
MIIQVDQAEEQEQSFEPSTRARELSSHYHTNID